MLSDKFLTLHANNECTFCKNVASIVSNIDDLLLAEWVCLETVQMGPLRVCDALGSTLKVNSVRVRNSLLPLDTLGRIEYLLFSDDILNHLACIKIVVLWFNLLRNLFPRARLTTSHDWFIWRPDAEQVTNHYLQRWWFSLVMHIPMA